MDRPGGGRDQAAEAAALSPEPLEPPDAPEEPPESLVEPLLLELSDDLSDELSDELVDESEVFVEPASVETESDFTVEPASALRPFAPEPWSFL